MWKLQKYCLKVWKNAEFKSPIHFRIFEAQYLKTLRTQIEPSNSQLTNNYFQIHHADATLLYHQYTRISLTLHTVSMQHTLPSLYIQ